MYMLVEEYPGILVPLSGMARFFETIEELEEEYELLVLGENIGYDCKLKAYKCEPFENKVEVKINKQRDEARIAKAEKRKNVLTMICKEDVKRLVKAFNEAGAHYGLEISDMIDEVEKEISNERK